MIAWLRKHIIHGGLYEKFFFINLEILMHWKRHIMHRLIGIQATQCMRQRSLFRRIFVVCISASSLKLADATFVLQQNEDRECELIEVTIFEIWRMNTMVILFLVCSPVVLMPKKYWSNLISIRTIRDHEYFRMSQNRIVYKKFCVLF